MNKKPIILVVEDDLSQLKIVMELLQSKDIYIVLGAENAAKAAYLMEREIPDLIISDYYMKGETGLDLCIRVKKHPLWRKTMFMLLTVEQEIALKVIALDLCADDYLNKPFHTDELLSRIRVLLRLKDLQDKLEKESVELRSANEMLNQNFEGLLNILTKLMTLRIPNAAARGAEAARLCRWMAERLNIDPERLLQIDIAARFHEIGKIGLSEDILKTKPENMTNEQKQRMIESMMVSEILMSGIQQFGAVANWERCQMENYDGSGYPDKLCGEEIPLEARLLRAVNFMEELTPAVLADSDCLSDTIQKARNTLLDPRVAQLLSEYVLLKMHPSWFEGKKQVNVFELCEGMTLASDLFTGNGKKLLPKNTIITQTILDRILSQHHYDPIVTGIYIINDATIEK